MLSAVVLALGGLGLMLAPGLLGYEGAARTADVVAGTLAAALGIVSLWEVTRALRRVGLVLGVGTLVGLALWPRGAAGTALAAAAALALAAGALLPGRARGRLGGGWAGLWRREGGVAKPVG